MDLTREEIERWRADVARRRVELFGNPVRDALPEESGPVCAHFRGAKFPRDVMGYIQWARRSGKSRADILAGIKARFCLIVHPKAYERAVKVVAAANKEPS